MQNAVEVHNSDISSFKRCRQLWEFQSPLHFNREPEIAARYFTFGTAYHSAIAAHRVNLDPVWAFTDTLDTWLRSLSDPDTEEVQEEYNEALELGLGMIAHYIKWEQAQPEWKNLEVIWVEKPFKVPILDGVIFSFKPDGLAQDEHGRLWLLEEKTTKSIRDTYDYLLLDDQAGRYIWGMGQVDGIDVVGTIYTFHRKKVPSQLRVLQSGKFSVDKRQDTTYEIAVEQLRGEYGGTIPVEYGDLLSNLRHKGNTFFHREPVRRNAGEIHRIGESLRMEVEDMLEAKIYRNPSSFNCDTCAFLGPCIAKWEGSDYKVILNGNYRERKPW